MTLLSYSDLNDEDDEDCGSDKENIDSSTSKIGVECSELVIRSLWIWETNTFSESNLQLWKIV
jgi:hypothetical protein